MLIQSPETVTLPGMQRVLITGMSGTGKSGLLEQLALRGYKTVETDGHPTLLRFVPGAGDARQCSQKGSPDSAESRATNLDDGADPAG